MSEENTNPNHNIKDSPLKPPAPPESKMVLVPEELVGAFNNAYLLKIAASLNTIEKYDEIMSDINELYMALNAITTKIIKEKDALRTQYKEERKAMSEMMNAVRQPESPESPSPPPHPAPTPSSPQQKKTKN